MELGWGQRAPTRGFICLGGWGLQDREDGARGRGAPGAGGRAEPAQKQHEWARDFQKQDCAKFNTILFVVPSATPPSPCCGLTEVR